LLIDIEAETVFVEATGERAIYGFEPGKRLEIFPASKEMFFRREAGSPQIQFDFEGPRKVVGITINPGHWPVKGVRIP
jgi:hypothetical protein